MTLVDWIEENRLQRGLSKEKLSYLTGVSTSSLYLWCRGKGKVSIGSLVKIEAVFGRAPNHLRIQAVNLSRESRKKDNPQKQLFAEYREIFQRIKKMKTDVPQKEYCERPQCQWAKDGRCTLAGCMMR